MLIPRSWLLWITVGVVAATRADAVAKIDLPGRPFGIAITSDQKWAFVSLAGREAGRPLGIAVLKIAGARITVDHVVATSQPPTGIVLTHDGKLLIAAAQDAVLFLDVTALTRGGGGAEVGSYRDPGAGIIFANVTRDDRTLFVSNESHASITVIDLARSREARLGSIALRGKIPVGNAPIALTLSPDERWLYTTSEVAPPGWGWPKTVRREGPGGGRGLVSEGAILVIDTDKARTDSAHAVVARVPAGGSPVRLVLSASGEQAFVTARNSNALLVFETAKLIADPAHARDATVPVGSSPVPLVVLDGGRRILVGNSNRFGTDAERASTLTLIDATKLSEGAAAVLGNLPAGAFPRDIELAPDGRMIFVANFLSRELFVFDAQHLPITAGAHSPEGSK